MGVSMRERLLFGLVLAGCLAGFFHESLFGGKVLSSADVLLAAPGAGAVGALPYEPENRLLVDPGLQFEPWLEFNRRMIRSGRLPLWNRSAGCGVPHLANGQSAVFDPFHLLAYLGDAASTRGLIAALRLEVAGLGMFLLAAAWGLGRWGRWFAGLAFPFGGFLVLWLLYPVAWAAVWMPWLLLAIDRALERPTPRAAGSTALATACTIVGGHIQTSAHVLLACLIYAAARFCTWRGRLTAAAGLILGIWLAAAQIIPLAGYLAKSTVWADRQTEHAAWWRIARPRVLDMARLVFPSIYGGQRRGQANLGRGLGAENLNESAAGYAGLATLIWLAPLGALEWRRRPRAGFLLALAAFGFLGSFRLPPLDNLLRALPILQVMDNRRMTLYLAFALPLLAGMGLDRLETTSRLPRAYISCWFVLGLILAGAAGGIGAARQWVRLKVEDRVLQEARVHGRPADASRAGHIAENVLTYIPLYFAWSAAELCTLGLLALWAGRGSGMGARIGVCASVAADLTVLGYGYNPAIERQVYNHRPAAVEVLCRRLRPGQRVLGLAGVLEPNSAMRYGLADPRDYDSIELAESVRFLEPLFESRSRAAPSRGTITWASAAQARDRLHAACVAAIVADQPPPPDFPTAEPAGSAWIVWLDHAPYIHDQQGNPPATTQIEDGFISFHVITEKEQTIFIHETWDPGWRATIDDRPTPIEPAGGRFMAIKTPPGRQRITLVYDPIEVRLGLAASAAALAVVILVLTGNRMSAIPGIMRRGLGRSQAVGLESKNGIFGNSEPNNPVRDKR